MPLVSSEQSRPSEVEDIGSYRAVGDKTIHRGSHWAPQQQTGRSQLDPPGPIAPICLRVCSRSCEERRPRELCTLDNGPDATALASSSTSEAVGTRQTIGDDDIVQLPEHTVSQIQPAP